MPSSDFDNIPFVVGQLQRLQPQSVLDVGIGFGKWGFLVREYLEAWEGRCTPDLWQLRIEGIEIWEAYRNPGWGIYYNHVHIGDAREIVSRLGNFDVGVCCDVIEHMNKSDGKELVSQILRVCKTLILTTPISFWEQLDSAQENKYEQHLSLWAPSDFDGYSGEIMELGSTYGAVLQPGRTGGKPTVRRRLDHIGVRPLAKAVLRRLFLKARGRV